MPLEYDKHSADSEGRQRDEEDLELAQSDSNSSLEARAEEERRRRAESEAEPEDRIAQLQARLAALSPESLVAASDATRVEMLPPEQRPAPEQVSDFEVLLVNQKMAGEKITHSELYVTDPDDPGSYVKVDFSPSSDMSLGTRILAEMASMAFYPVPGKGNCDRGFSRPTSRVTQVIRTSETINRNFLALAEIENGSGRWDWYRAYWNNCQDHTSAMLDILDSVMSSSG